MTPTDPDSLFGAALRRRAALRAAGYVFELDDRQQHAAQHEANRRWIAAINRRRTPTR